MKIQKLQNAVALAQKTGHLYLATADANAIPHMAAAGKLSSKSQDTIEVTEWFCPGTVANLEQNKSIAIAVWDCPCDVGYQLLGRVERIDDMAILDGYATGIETKHKYPQSEKQLLIKIDKILDFTLAPHCDLAV